MEQNKKIRLLLVRHGESEGNIKPEYICGRANQLPLTDLGKKQAVAFGKMMQQKNIKPNYVFSSTAKRAFDTALICTEQIGCCLPIITSEQLLELDQGEWTNKKRSDIYTPEVVSQIDSNRLDFVPPGQVLKVVLML